MHNKFTCIKKGVSDVNFYQNFPYLYEILAAWIFTEGIKFPNFDYFFPPIVLHELEIIVYLI